jgi:hypothetical protein
MFLSIEFLKSYFFLKLTYCIFLDFFYFFSNALLIKTLSLIFIQTNLNSQKKNKMKKKLLVLSPIHPHGPCPLATSIVRHLPTHTLSGVRCTHHPLDQTQNR